MKLKPIKSNMTTSRHISTWLNGIHANELPQEEIDNLVK